MTKCDTCGEPAELRWSWVREPEGVRKEPEAVSSDLCTACAGVMWEKAPQPMRDSSTFADIPGEAS